MTTDYTVVTVLHRSRPELQRLLDSLDRATPPAQLIVVDTGPDDGGADLARAHGARVLERRDNPGFGAANNFALTHVDTPTTVLLNPDVIVHGDALARLARRAATHAPPALHAPRLLNPDGTVQRSAHPLPGTLGAFLPALVHPPLLPRALKHRVEPYRSGTPRSVGWAIAAALAAPTRTLKALGPFDPRIHLFAEDLDLCLRARAARVPTLYHPDLALTHTGGHSTAHEEEPYAQLARNRSEAVGRTLGSTARALDDAAQLLTFAVRAAVKRPNPRERAQMRAVLDQRPARRARPRP
jgi:N-acetylglucosaminyl-diphospho-decaprenol L-rhamnosyltransferase